MTRCKLLKKDDGDSGSRCGGSEDGLRAFFMVYIESSKMLF